MLKVARGSLLTAPPLVTAPVPPTVVTSAASAVVDVSATLNGSANPNGTATTGWFRYAATSPGAVSGGYYGPSRFLGLVGPATAVRIPRSARHPAIAARLWAEAERLTGVALPDQEVIRPAT